ncbi:tRNA (adenosine(37)-N6)-dimethylallyltransferase MiaA [Botrimarina hoheduenensis]|uniref:tRNA dimethylallyltransferase n=1 Tax=Botrimarina hoheduenensis TaxID=2528000 RepID=A0A5C5WFS4_9BACT|nr:tRNA (adenosine(37)-N6)-dimethylallyltransferase MiaA [Botrimarina hoheduenensis]TWT48612.1 IPP transferase [Botrimarina hoheduenensis]
MEFDFAGNCWFLTGATAAGKTSVGIALAERLGRSGPPVEILSLDSMAIYRGMDIGTAKPSASEQALVPHHLIDLRDPNQEFSVAEYRQAAQDVCRRLVQRNATPLFVGGTPLYLKCLLRGLFEGPGANWDLRREIETELDRVGPAALHERLQMVDPLAASTIHPNDARRIVRALEVYRGTGQPISHQQMEFDDARPAESCRVFVLRRDRIDQHDRIEKRVDQMIAEGFQQEVEGLIANGKTLGRSASQAVGYREMIEHLNGTTDLATTIERIQARTRRFAKRQGTWFRSLSECTFVDIGVDESPAAIAERIERLAAEGR